MIPFRVAFRAGEPLHEQVALAARRAILAGQLRPGDAFPSVRTLSKSLKINPNTAHKVVAQLTAEGLLEVQPGIGTVVARAPAASRAERRSFLECEVEALVIEARRLGLDLDDLQDSIAEHWDGLRPVARKGNS